MTLLTHSPESFTSNSDSARAKQVDDLDAPVIDQIAEEIAKNNNSSIDQAHAETVADFINVKEKTKQIAGGLILRDVFPDISINDYASSSEPHDDLYPYSWFLEGNNNIATFGDGDELFSTGEQSQDTAHESRSSHNIWPDVDN